MIAVVTGASRGAGKGIAIALGEAGATVYVTGRSVESSVGGTIGETAELVSRAGGKGSPSRSSIASMNRSRSSSRGSRAKKGSSTSS